MDQYLEAHSHWRASRTIKQIGESEGFSGKTWARIFFTALMLSVIAGCAAIVVGNPGIFSGRQ